MFKNEKVALDEEQIRAVLDWQETRSGNIEAFGVMKMLDSRAGSCLELIGCK